MPAEQTIDQAKGLIDVLLALLDWPFLLFVFLLTNLCLDIQEEGDEIV